MYVVLVIPSVHVNVLASYFVFKCKVLLWNEPPKNLVRKKNEKEDEYDDDDGGGGEETFNLQ